MTDMRETIRNNKYVELAYRVIDGKSGDVLVAVEFPIGYVHGANDVLMPSVTKDLEGRSPGDIIEASFNGDHVYGPRDESLVFTDYVENVPEEYRKVGTSILAESENGKTRSFIVTRVDDKTLTLDGNNPLCGRDVVFKLEVLDVRDATDEEIEAGGPVDAEPDVNRSLLMPI